MLPSLPTIPLPTFNVDHPDIPGGRIRLKPFTLGLESILLQAKGIADDDTDIKIQEIIDAIHQVIDACAVDATFKAEQLPTWCVELIYLRLRQHSIGEVVPLKFICQTKVPVDKEDETKGTKVCNTSNQVNLDIREAKVESGAYTNKFVVHEDGPNSIAVQFKHMGIGVAGMGITTNAQLLANHIELITHGDEVFKASAYPKEKLLEFVYSIPIAKKEEIQKLFFDSVPVVTQTLKFKCSGCGEEHTIKLNGLKDFFD